MKKFVKNHFLVIILIIISILKLCLTQRLPLSAYPKQVYDDALMVKLAKSIIEGHWLGVYDNNTLIKGAGYPVFLAILKFINIPYMLGMDLLYILACMYFIYSLKDDIKNNVIRIIVFVVMLFNPISYAEYTFQRVYRNGTGVFQTIFIFSAIYIIWKNKFESIKSLLPHILIASVNVAFLWHTRDDSMWIIPFLFVALLLSSICIIVNYTKTRKSTGIKISSTLLKVVCILMPLWILVFSTTSIKLLNYKKYGMFIEKEGNANLGKVLNIFYEVKANEKVYRTDNTREKIDRMCEVSETLNSIKPHLDDSMDTWTQFDSNPDDNEVENGWFSWALEYAVRNAGMYFSPQESNEFYGKIYDEIKLALDEGKLEKEQDLLVSFLPPFHEEYKKDLFKFYLGYLEYITEFREMKSVNDPSEESTNIDGMRLRDFEFVTGNRVVTRDSTNVRLLGWYYLKNNEDFKLYLSNEKREKIAEISRIDSSDIINHFSLNPNYKYRFDFVLTDIEKEFEYEKLFISSYTLNNEFIEEIPLDEYIQDAAIENDISMHSITIASIDKNVDPLKAYSNTSIVVLNSIQSIYSHLGKILSYTSIIIYFVLVILAIVKLVKNKCISNEFNLSLILTAILLSMLLVTAGVAYTGLTACYTFMYLYLAVTFPLLIMYITISIGYFIDCLFNKIKNT